MSEAFSERTFGSAGGGMLHSYRWSPAEKPIAVVQLVHGIAEHAFRYDEFARYLNEQGFLVVAHDHQGHGKSGGTPLFFDGGWNAAVQDVAALMEQTHKELPDVPYFLFGHSMGSFLTRTLLYRYPDAPLRGVILCGTAWQPKPVLLAGRALCAMERLRVGEKKTSKLLQSVMFGAYNSKFKPVRTPNDWICSRIEVVDAYTADPLCGGAATVGLSQEMLRGLSMNQQKKNLNAMPKQLPVRFIAGKCDPVGAMGKGVLCSANAFRKAGMQQVSLQLFDGRHEIHNEENRTEVYADVGEFIKKQL